MKIAVYPAILFMLCVLSCTDKSVIVADPADRYEAMECIDPSSNLQKVNGGTEKKDSASYTVQLAGDVEVNEAGDVYIVVNAGSKSRKSYLVTGTLKTQVATMKGKTVHVKCCYLESGKWSGTVRVYEIYVK